MIKMTLDEAIVYCEKENTDIYKQLAEWLKELKELKTKMEDDGK